MIKLIKQLEKNATYRGTNWRKNVSWGKGKFMYSIIFSTASDFMYDLESINQPTIHSSFHLTAKFFFSIICNHKFLLSSQVITRKFMVWKQILLNIRYTYLSFSTRTTLEISSGALPDLLSNILPASLWSASYLIVLYKICTTKRNYLFKFFFWLNKTKNPSLVKLKEHQV